MGGDTELQQLSKTDRNPIQESRYQELMKGSGGGGNPYDSLMSGLPKASEFASTLDNSENNAFKDYLSVAGNQQKPLDFYKGALGEAGVPQMRKTASSLQGQIYEMEDTLRRVEGDVMANSRNSIVTDSQRRGMTSERQRPMIENLGWLGQSLGRVSNAITNETSNAATLTGLNQQGQQMELDPYKMRIQMVADQNARKMTGFTTDLQNSLQVGLSKIQRGEQLDDREFQRVAELAKMEKQYEMEKSSASQYLTIGEGTTVFDPNTGRVVYKADKTSASGGGGGGFNFGNTVAPQPTSAPPTNKPAPKNTNTSSSYDPKLYSLIYGGGTSSGVLGTYGAGSW